MSTHWVSTDTFAFRSAKIRQPTWKRFAEAVREWQRRASSRRELSALSRLDIKDIGYPVGMDAEKRKPFWRS